MGGYVFEWRDAMENPADNEDILDAVAGRYQAWRYLVQRARWQPGEMKWTTKRGEVIPVPRGAFVTTFRRFGEDLGWSHHRARRTLEAWQRRGRVVLTPSHGFVLVTLCNYEHYNPPVEEAVPESSRERPTPVPGSSHARPTKEESNTGNTGKKNSHARARRKPPGQTQPTGAEPDAETVVLEYLRDKSGRAIETDNAKHREWVRKRLNEGRTVEDCKAVIDNRVRRWGRDPERRELLRPSTLFRPDNFANYLADARDGTPGRVLPDRPRVGARKPDSLCCPHAARTDSHELDLAARVIRCTVDGCGCVRSSLREATS